MAPSYSESDMQGAVEAVLEGVGQRKAALQWAVPRSSLRDRLLEKRSKAEYANDRQKVSKTCEDKVVEWIIKQEALGYAPSHHNVRYICTKLLQLQNRGEETPKLGKHWISGFLQRNPLVRTKIGRRLDYKRVNAACPDNINAFFNRREIFSWIKPESTYNADESGIMEGMGLVNIPSIIFVARPD